ncbi:LysR family transcriptional regulator [Piscinibacter sp.]|uniref:LysR family transcriptional regulator n=1 Tax=Piscinibacter sp. TaxID=1903157 RepID=UPI002C838098|nr:LysR family transcriptional regulator [Albitalea sp.]HUG25914.1 LysR family transcriptional regulator [Albitalea sp.]
MTSRRLQETSLRYFLEVVRCGSITEASRRLNVAVSAISRQIKGLEDVLGTVLFERRPRGMVPSAAGELLAAHARKSALEADRVVGDILALQGQRSGNVRLATTEGFSVEFLPQLIAQFQQRYPEIMFQLHVSAPAEVTRRIGDGDADIGLTFSRTPEKGIKVEHRQPAPVVAVMRRDHPLAKFKQVLLAQLQAYPLALPDPDTTVRQLFDIGCSRQQLLVEPVFTSNYFQALFSFAAVGGGGITIAGEVSVRQRVAAGEMVAIRIRDRGMDGRSIEVQTLIGRTLPRAVQTFLDFLRNRLSETDPRVRV